MRITWDPRVESVGPTPPLGVVPELAATPLTGDNEERKT